VAVVIGTTARGHSHRIRPLDHCNVQKHTGVNNLPEVVIRQRRGRESNSSCKSKDLSTTLPSMLLRKVISGSVLQEHNYGKMHVFRS